MRIGILGGTFDPPHAGHLHISTQALVSLQLDQVWWLPSVQNPLKTRQPQSFEQRIKVCEVFASHPRIRIKPFEAELKSNFTFDSLGILRRWFPAYKFVWLMGADNLVDFHRWYKWQQLMEKNYCAVFSRPGYNLPALASIAAHRYALSRLPSDCARMLLCGPAPRWVFLRHSMCDISSTMLRKSMRGEI